MNWQETIQNLQQLLSISVFNLGSSKVTLWTVLFLIISLGTLVIVSRTIRQHFTVKFLGRFELSGTVAERLALFLHIILITAGALLVIDLSELDVTAMEILQAIDRIMSEPLIPIGKTNVTLWTIVYMTVLSITLLVVTGKLQHWIVDNLLKSSKIDMGIKYGVSMIAKYIVLALGFLVIAQSAGIDLSSLTILAGALGLGLSFGLQNIVANFVSGFTIIVERHVKVGDRVEVDGVLGNVTRIKLRSTTILTNDNVEIIVPNSHFVTSKVTNLSHSSKEVRLNFPIGVSYKSDPKHVREVVLKVVSEHEGILKKPAPELIFLEFGESSLNFYIRVWTVKYAKTPDLLQSEVLYEVFDAFRKEGIEIPFPQRDLHLKSSQLSSMK